MKKVICGLFIVVFLGATQLAYGGHPSKVGGITAEKAMTLLKDGNQRFVSGKMKHPNMKAARRKETSSKGQHPFATVIGCSDSRVPVETVFDRGLGDIFTFRVAGNVCNVDEAGSIEYGVEHLSTPLFVVLGHTQCGAVTAVVDGADVHGNIPKLVANIKPAVAQVRKEQPDLKGEALIEASIKSNVFQTIEDLFKRSPEIRASVRDKKVVVVGAVYDIGSGKVEWLGGHPDEEKLIMRR